MRYFLWLSYDGTRYNGWQAQPEQLTVQGEIERALKVYYRKEITIYGCGRTDTGVHASKYCCHLDSDVAMDFNDLYHLNAILHADTVLIEIQAVRDDAHARFDAYSRSYQYFIRYRKSPFHINHSFPVYYFDKIDQDLLQAAADTITAYRDFTTFCKVESDVKSNNCDISTAMWEFYDNHAVFSITANRFLRGMVRMIVGMNLNVAIGKIQLDDVIDCLENQQRMKIDWSVPACGLFLCDVKYPKSVFLK